MCQSRIKLREKITADSRKIFARGYADFYIEQHKKKLELKNAVVEGIIK